MPTYRKKPVEIQAVQFTGYNADEVLAALASHVTRPECIVVRDADYSLEFETVHGDRAIARAGDWVIPDGRAGTFYPCKPDIFAATYEPVSDGAS
jgi:hypothetical protein